VFVHVCDVVDAAAVQKWVIEAEAKQPIDTLVINAGIFDGHGAGNALETADEARRLIDTNLSGAIFCAQAALPHMIKRRRGHLAFVSSLAALQPLADAPTYSATKAGLAAYAAALREYLLDYGVTVTTILPGHVRTDQTALHAGPTPMIINPEHAARFIAEGLRRRRGIVAFPLFAHWLVRAGIALPLKMRALLSRPSRFYCRKPRADGSG